MPSCHVAPSSRTVGQLEQPTKVPIIQILGSYYYCTVIIRGLLPWNPEGILGAERPPLSEKKLLRFLASQQQDSWVTRGDVIICYQVSTASKGTIKVNELSC